MSDLCKLPKGVWPVMLTPFLSDASRTIDWTGLDALVSWYLEANVSGLFACCLSSEAYQLSGEEQTAIAKRVISAAGGRAPVVVGVMGQTTNADSVRQIQICRDLGAKAAVLNIAEWVARDESDNVLVDRLESLIDRVPDIDLGLYECPLPYHRLLSAGVAVRLANTGRFTFLKETSCAIDTLAAKINAVQGTRLRVYNANAELLSASLAVGAAGYSGVEANFCPSLCVWLCRHANSGGRSERVQQLITKLHNDPLFRKYPTSCKAFLRLEGVAMEPACRNQNVHLDDGDYEVLRVYKGLFDKLAKELSPQACVPVLTQSQPTSRGVAPDRLGV